MRDVISSGDIIVSNQVSVLEFIFLNMAYAPTFTAVCREANTGKYGLRKVGLLELPFFAMGIKFPVEVKEGSSNFFTDLAALKASLYV